MDRKEYMKMYHRKWYIEKIKPLKERYFNNKKCEWCGSTLNLELHHLDPSKKLGHKIWTWSESRRNEELDKCIILCRDCHRNYHNQKRIKHGIKRYQKGCRCDICRKAKSVQNAKRIRKKMAG